MITGPDGEQLPPEVAEMAELVSELLDVLETKETSIGLRALSSTLSMIVVQTAPSREHAENLIESLCDTILDIIETMDDARLAGWNENDTRTLQ